MSNVVAAEAAQLSSTEVEKLDANLAGTSPLANLDGQTLDALGVLIVVLADNEMFHGLRVASWTTGAPTLESAVACAAVAQDKLGHSRALYPLLEELPLAQVGPAHPADDPRKRYALSFFDTPFDNWGQVVAALALVGPAMNILFQALTNSAFVPLARRAQHILGEEQLTSVYAEGLVRDLVAFEGGQAILQRYADALLPEVLCWFGPPGEPGFALLVDAGLIGGDNEALRQVYTGRVAPLLTEVGIQTSLRRDQETEVWIYEPLPWNAWNRRQRRLNRA
jgi:ring-1,2-phenylacetyl-CoA epoxidase subunit PaaC